MFLVVGAPGARAQNAVLWKLWAGFGYPEYSVAAPGDVNGDGVPDIAVGIRNSFPAPGQLRVLSGADGNILYTTTGGAGDSYGTSLAVLGDMDGDAVSELLVGAPQIGTGPGYVRVFSGASGATLLTVTGSATGDWFGHAVDSAGDVDGDGFEDFVASAAYAGNYVRVVSGANGTTIHTLSVFGPFSVAGVGDATGDGVPDVAVGNLPGPGMVRLFSGATGGQVWVVSGPVPNDGFGSSLTGPGDVNGDGLGDVVVGAPGVPFMGPGPHVSVLSGANGATLYDSFGGGYFGWSVSRAGDANGDGIPDFAVGGPPPDFAVGVASLRSGVDGTGLFVAWEPAYPNSSDSFFARRIAVSPDIDGDGAPELLVGALGAVWVFSTGSVPAGTSHYGVCPVAPLNLPTPPFVSTMGGPPVTGNGSFALVTSGLPVAGLSGTLIVGLSTVTPPVNLLPLAGTCYLSTFPDFLVPTMTNATGAASVSLPIPAVPALVGVVVYFQWNTAFGPPPTTGKLSLGLQVTVL